MSHKMSKKELSKLAARVSVTSYLSYRDYLAKVYSVIRESLSNYSYLRFSEDLGLSKSNVSWLLITGRRRLTPRSMEIVVSSLGLKGIKRKYFEALVKYNNARLPEKREKLFQDLLQLKKNSLPGEVEVQTLEYFAEWFNPVIREMTGLSHFKSDPAWISAQLHEKLLPKQAKECLELLEKLGLVKFDGQRGRHVRTGGQVFPNRDVGAMAAVRFHQKMIEIAREAVTRVPEDYRDINAMTLSLNKKDFRKVVRLIRNTLREVMRIEDQSENPDGVYQLNFQLFAFNKGKGTKES